MAPTAQVPHVIVDAVAFFKNVQLQDFSEKIYTVQAVVDEIRDSATRQRLSVLPYELNYRQPSSESIQFVSEFARKTGEYRSLSATDIQVIALAYQLTKEHVGTEKLRKEPEIKKTFSSNKKPLEKSTDIVGFYFPQGKDKGSSGTDGSLSTEGDIQLNIAKLNVSEESSRIHRRGDQEANFNVPSNWEDKPENENESISDQIENEPTHVLEKYSVDKEDIGEDEGQLDSRSESGTNFDQDSSEIEGGNGNKGSGEEAEETNEDGDEGIGDEGIGDDDVEVGWITPENLVNAQKEMRKDIMDSLDGVGVGCLTTDFAMQNVLIQIGIPVLSLDGMLIKRAKSFVLRCYACYKITHDTNKQFCPKCGNKTLMKVSKSIDSEGRQHYHIPNRKPFSAKGKQTSLPTPKGGKHAFNPVTCEDQPQPQIRMSKKAMIRNNVFDPDYVAQNSPFITRDVTSRSALLGFAKQQRNAPQKRGKRK